MVNQQMVHPSTSARIHRERDSPLHAAARAGNAAQLVALLDGGADPNQADEVDATALMSACYWGYEPCARLLLDRGADPNQARPDGWTALTAACHQGRTACAQTLSAYGASRQADVHGLTPEQLATTYGHLALAAWFAATRDFTTPLHHAEFISADRARALLRGGADVHARSGPDGRTPLEVARQLVEQGAGDDSAAALFVKAAQPWSPDTHELFPEPARRRAVQLLWTAASHKGKDIKAWWLVHVLPHAITRDTDVEAEARAARVAELMAEKAGISAARAALTAPLDAELEAIDAELNESSLLG